MNPTLLIVAAFIWTITMLVLWAFLVGMISELPVWSVWVQTGASGVLIYSLFKKPKNGH